jgi:hypothetical protein
MATKKGELLVLDPGEMTAQERNRIEATNRGLRVLNTGGADADEYAGKMRARRLPYASMRAHQEMAAQALASGATIKMAAKYAGVSPRQVKKYFTDVDFRERIEELRSTMLSRLKGRIVRELGRRTSGKEIQKLELLDILRIGDRVGLARGSAADEKAGNGPSNNTYEAIFNTVILSHSGAQGGDFPVYEPNDTSVPGEDTPF